MRSATTSATWAWTARLHLKDIKLPDGVKALQDEDLIIATVKEIAEAETTEAAEGATAEPEIIGKKKEDAAAPAAQRRSSQEVAGCKLLVAGEEKPLCTSNHH